MCSREIDPKFESNFCSAAFNSGLFLEPVSTATINASLSRIVAVFESPLAPCQTTTNKEKELTQTKIGHTHAEGYWLCCVDCDCVVVVIVVGCRCVTFVFGGARRASNSRKRKSKREREWCGSEIREEKGSASVSFYCSRTDVAKLSRFSRSHMYAKIASLLQRKRAPIERKAKNSTQTSFLLL